MMSMRGFLFRWLLVCVWSAAAQAGESASFVLSPDGHWLYSANFDGGSVTRIARQNPQQRQEARLGKDLERLALSDDGRDLLVSDYLAGQVYLVDATNLQLRKTVPVGRRPFGIVYDPAHRWFWVALFEDHQLVAVDRNGQIRQRLHTEETPRGLALTRDQRLLVTHAMIGKLSLYDVRQDEPRLLKVLSLEETADPDQFVSQGLPRLLDDISLAPDESEAWLPHVLWNFDHPFQFQSTVFPAVSIIDLTPGEEAERTSERKQLFKQMNILSNANRTLIMSNPLDAAFSADGNKVYITAAGSEDLLVFDRARASSGSHKRSKRRQGKIDQGGAQLVQLLRHLPGDNPRGLVVDGDDILVQNAMSLDVTRVSRGGDSPFARATVTEPHWAVTVAEDPLPRQLRLGETLFQQGNTDKHPRIPMTGDSWMSCSSCHLDGFNFSNRYLMDADRQDDSRNAVSGHGKLGNMVSGDFLTDYIRMVQDTQGGLGHDDRDGAMRFQPEQPPDAVLSMMSDLHTFVVAPQNLPFLASWLRLDDPAGQAHPQAWLNSASCATCHSDIFDQWVDSNHRLAAQSNPYYRVLEDLAAQTEGEGFRAWCSGCHNPARVSVGQPFRGSENHMLENGGASLKQALQTSLHGVEEGTGCLFCHRVTQLEDAGGNAAMTVNLKDREQYLLETSNVALLRWFGERQINAKPDVHVASYSQDFYDDARYCAACHDEFSPGLGAKIVSTYEEWAASSFNNPADPSQHRSCIDCHMHADSKRIGEAIPGHATDGGPQKENVVTHQFTGANHFLVGLRNGELEKLSLDLLKTSATLDLSLDGEAVVVRVTNVGAGHALPTGVADFRELWLQVRVRDSQGRLVLESGIPDAAGHLPEDAHLFRKVFGDEEGKPVGLRFWRYAKLLEDTRIPANGFRDERFPLPVEIQYPLQVEAALMFRIYPQWVTDVVKQQVPELTDPPVVTLKHLEVRLDQSHAQVSMGAPP